MELADRNTNVEKDPGEGDHATVILSVVEEAFKMAHSVVVVYAPGLAGHAKYMIHISLIFINQN